MPRRSSVRYWPSRGTWQDEHGDTQHGAFCCWFKGKQHVLAEGPNDQKQDGPVFNAAVKKLVELKMLGNASVAKDTNNLQTVCELYLRHVHARKKISTYELRSKYLQPIVSALGKTAVHALTPHMVNAFLDRMREWRTHSANGRRIRWAGGSIRNAVQSLHAALNWAVADGLISKNPLKGLKPPRARSRGREALIGRTPAERAANHRRILAATTKAFRPFVIVLAATGCRPSELAAATAADFNPELGAIVYHADDTRLEGEFSHKTAHHGKDRVILLTGEALEIVKGLVRKHPKGPLFRTRHNIAWSIRSIMGRFQKLQELVGIPQLTAYSYRHTFATSWLEQGKSVDILAELLGNTPAVIRQHYSHLLGDVGNLRRQLEAFSAFTAGAADAQTPPTAANGDGASSAV
jgi:integrase